MEIFLSCVLSYNIVLFLIIIACILPSLLFIKCNSNKNGLKLWFCIKIITGDKHTNYTDMFFF